MASNVVVPPTVAAAPVTDWNTLPEPSANSDDHNAGVAASYVPVSTSYRKTAPSAAHDPALAEYRIKRFMSDIIPTSPPFHSATSEEEIIHLAKEKAMENVLAVDQALGNSTENPLKKT